MNIIYRRHYSHSYSTFIVLSYPCPLNTLALVPPNVIVVAAECSAVVLVVAGPRSGPGSYSVDLTAAADSSHCHCHLRSQPLAITVWSGCEL